MLTSLWQQWSSMRDLWHLGGKKAAMHWLSTSLCCKRSDMLLQRQIKVTRWFWAVWMNSYCDFYARLSGRFYRVEKICTPACCAFVSRASLHSVWDVLTNVESLQVSCSWGHFYFLLSPNRPRGNMTLKKKKKTSCCQTASSLQTLYQL